MISSAPPAYRVDLDLAIDALEVVPAPPKNLHGFGSARTPWSTCRVLQQEVRPARGATPAAPTWPGWRPPVAPCRLVPDHLMMGERLAEGVPLSRIGNCLIETDLRVSLCSLPRALVKLSMIMLKPLPSSPRRFAAGTRQYSKYSVAVSEAHRPILNRFCSAEARRCALDEQDCTSHWRAAPPVHVYRNRKIICTHAGGDEGLLPIDAVVIIVENRRGVGWPHR